MDAFFASVEQAINPSLKGKPLIVGSQESKYHTVVCAASYEAKRLGIDSGMPTKEAFLICPQAHFVPADSARYLFVSNQIFELLKPYPAALNRSSIDEFDMEFCDNGKNELLSIGKEIKKSIQNEFQLTCSIGIAPNWQLAKLGSKIEKPNGLILIDQNNHKNLLKNIPIEKVCGIGPALTKYLNELGIINCNQLLEYPKNLLIQRFGKIGNWLADCLKTAYKDSLPKNTTETYPKSISHSYTLPQQTSNQTIIYAWLRMLSEMVAQRLRKLNIESHTITVWASNHPNTGFYRQKTFQAGTCLGSEIFFRSRGILGLKNGKKMAIRALGINASGLCNKSQISLFKKEQNEEFLGRLMDKINGKFGDWTLYPAIVNLTHKKK